MTEESKTIDLKTARDHYMVLMSAVFELFAERPLRDLHAFLKKASPMASVVALELMRDEAFVGKFVDIRNAIVPPHEGPYPHPPDSCRSCGGALVRENRRVPDGCPCSPHGGANHGLVPKNTCTCQECDPDGTGLVRLPPPGAS